MSASTSLIADTKTVIANGPNSATLAKAINPAGPIMDYAGNTGLLLLKLQEADVLLNKIKTDTDSSDSTNLTNINHVLAALEGTSSPSGTVITTMQTVFTAGPNSATLAKAINPAGPIMDYQGNVSLVILKLQEAEVLIGKIITDTDASDSANLTLLQNIQTALS